MKRTILGLLGLSVLGFGGFACTDGTDDTLLNGAGTTTRAPVRDPADTVGSEESTYDHSNDPGGAAPGAAFEPADPAQVRAVGSPEVTSRLHACGKLTVSSLAQLIDSRGLAGTGARPDRTASGKDIFGRADTAAALGGANYNGRVPEAPFASTSAVSKMFDIFTMASYDVVADNWAPKACPGTKILQDGKFTKDGISCLIGKPATDEHVAIANDAVTKSPTDGAKIAIAALLAAAHTCQ